jgi:3-oxoadipate enol-lactonase
MTVTLHRVVDAAPSLPAGAPVVLMLGGIGTSLDMWRAQVPGLSTRFRVVRADTRGHGGSPVPDGRYDIDDLADDALAVLDDLGVGRAHLVGLSLGGMTALRIAARHPDRVDRLAVLCTSALLGPPQMWVDRVATVRSNGMAAVADGAVDRWLTPGFRAANPAVVSWLDEMVRAQPALGYSRCCGVIERMDLRADLPAVRAPLLAIAGREDPTTPPDHLAAIVEGVREGRLLVVDDAAHLANVEQAEAVTAAVLEHLQGGRTTTEEHGG